MPYGRVCGPFGPKVEHVKMGTTKLLVFALPLPLRRIASGRRNGAWV